MTPLKPVTGSPEDGSEPERHDVTITDPVHNQRPRRHPHRQTAGPVDRARLAEVMGAVASGDVSAVFELHALCRHQLSSVVRAELRRHHIHHVDNDDLHGLVIDACLAIADRAGTWQPDGALPWHWARHRITAVVGAWVGQFADGFDPLRHDVALSGGGVSGAGPAEPWVGDEPPMVALLAELGRRHPVVDLFHRALGEAGSPRDQEVFVAYVVQQQAGDHSPAVTVGVMFDMTPEAVRKAVSRLRASLRRLVANDPRFAVLEGLPIVE